VDKELTVHKITTHEEHSAYNPCHIVFVNKLKQILQTKKLTIWTFEGFGFLLFLRATAGTASYSAS